MKLLLILGATLASAAVLAACGSGGGGSATASMPSASGKTVSVASVGDAGRVLVDSSGQALYASDQEASGKVMCTGSCLSFWKPLTTKTAPTESGVSGKVGTLMRPDDGAQQVTLNGKPLYTFVQDSPGEATGDGFQDAFNGQQFTWNVQNAMGSGSSASSSSSSSSSSGGGYSY
jgi:predicted lipoprotein with Yx(FWY)xxD motif